jgi:hypothetical protein
VINYHKHLFNCEHNETIKRICIACKFEAWNNAKQNVAPILGKSFEQMLNKADEELLHDMHISWR